MRPLRSIVLLACVAAARTHASWTPGTVSGVPLDVQIVAPEHFVITTTNGAYELLGGSLVQGFSPGNVVGAWVSGNCVGVIDNAAGAGRVTWGGSSCSTPSSVDVFVPDSNTKVMRHNSAGVGYATATDTSLFSYLAYSANGFRTSRTMSGDTSASFYFTNVIGVLQNGLGNYALAAAKDGSGTVKSLVYSVNGSAPVRTFWRHELPKDIELYADNSDLQAILVTETGGLERATGFWLGSPDAGLSQAPLVSSGSLLRSVAFTSEGGDAGRGFGMAVGPPANAAGADVYRSVPNPGEMGRNWGVTTVPALANGGTPLRVRCWDPTFCVVVGSNAGPTNNFFVYRNVAGPTIDAGSIDGGVVWVISETAGVTHSLSFGDVDGDPVFVSWQASDSGTLLGPASGFGNGVSPPLTFNWSGTPNLLCGVASQTFAYDVTASDGLAAHDLTAKLYIDVRHTIGPASPTFDAGSIDAGTIPEVVAFYSSNAALCPPVSFRIPTTPSSDLIVTLDGGTAYVSTQQCVATARTVHTVSVVGSDGFLESPAGIFYVGVSPNLDELSTASLGLTAPPLQSRWLATVHTDAGVTCSAARPTRIGVTLDGKTQYFDGGMGLHEWTFPWDAGCSEQFLATAELLDEDGGAKQETISIQAPWAPNPLSAGTFTLNAEAIDSGTTTAYTSQSGLECAAQRPLFMTVTLALDGGYFSQSPSSLVSGSQSWPFSGIPGKCGEQLDLTATVAEDGGGSVTQRMTLAAPWNPDPFGSATFTLVPGPILSTTVAGTDVVLSCADQRGLNLQVSLRELRDGGYYRQLVAPTGSVSGSRQWSFTNVTANCGDDFDLQGMLTDSDGGGPPMIQTATLPGLPITRSPVAMAVLNLDAGQDQSVIFATTEVMGLTCIDQRTSLDLTGSIEQRGGGLRMDFGPSKVAGPRIFTLDAGTPLHCGEIFDVFATVNEPGFGSKAEQAVVRVPLIPNDIDAGTLTLDAGLDRAAATATAIAVVSGDLQCFSQRGLKLRVDIAQQGGSYSDFQTPAVTAPGPYSAVFSPFTFHCGEIFDITATLSDDTQGSISATPKTLQADADPIGLQSSDGGVIVARCGQKASSRPAALAASDQNCTGRVTWTYEVGTGPSPLESDSVEEPGEIVLSADAGLAEVGRRLWFGLTAKDLNGVLSSSTARGWVEISTDERVLEMRHRSDTPLASESDVIRIKVLLNNSSECGLSGVSHVETLNGLRYVQGSAQKNGVAVPASACDGVDTLCFDGIDVPGNGEVQLTYLARPVLMASVRPSGQAFIKKDFRVELSRDMDVGGAPLVKGCGCSGTSGATALWPTLLAFAAGLRRRRRSR